MTPVRLRGLRLKFLLDENFPKAAIPLLEAAGHQVFDLRGSGDEGIDERQGPTSGRSGE